MKSVIENLSSLERQELIGPLDHLSPDEFELVSETPYQLLPADEEERKKLEASPSILPTLPGTGALRREQEIPLIPKVESKTRKKRIRRALGPQANKIHWVFEEPSCSIKTRKVLDKLLNQV